MHHSLKPGNALAKQKSHGTGLLWPSLDLARGPHQGLSQMRPCGNRSQEVSTCSGSRPGTARTNVSCRRMCCHLCRAASRQNRNGTHLAMLPRHESVGCLGRVTLLGPRLASVWTLFWRLLTVLSLLPNCVMQGFPTPTNQRHW